MKEIIKEIYAILLFSLFRILPLQNKVVFSSYWGKNCADNPKYISDKLLETNSKIKQVWIVRNKNNMLNPKIKTVKWGSIKMIYELSTAKVWVDNHTKPQWIKKRRNQLYIQTWHGGLGMKKIEADLGAKLEKKSQKQIMYNSKIADLFISNSTFLTNIYKRAFWYKGPILECGFPKNDIFFESDKNLQNIKDKVYKELKIPNNKKIVLYAPTYRKDEQINCYNIDYKKLIHTLKEKFKEEFICIVRLHPRMSEISNQLDIFCNDIIDGSKYNDMQELIIASNVFITDYSSGIFDFALMYKPAFIYASDIEQYENERGLYFDLNVLPFSVSKNNEELERNIKNFEYSEYKKKLINYFKLEDVGLKEKGQASEKIVKIIEKFMILGKKEFNSNGDECLK